MRSSPWCREGGREGTEEEPDAPLCDLERGTPGLCGLEEGRTGPGVGTVRVVRTRQGPELPAPAPVLRSFALVLCAGPLRFGRSGGAQAAVAPPT
ncbi:hypothetical protein GCM10009549_19120 [Streptomyces thermoalcalitolerans]|uniref:Uncharacterized protein n=1 Tax=Streptomyces thermoalcalitolerans TaxID=65605 RepID=A0ABP3YXM9_9ACTN